MESHLDQRFDFGEVTMLDDAEISRFKRNLDCVGRDCDWHEDRDGVAWCEVCGSGYLPSARSFLQRYYEKVDANRQSPV